MRLLYLTRNCTIHDLRFVEAYEASGFTVGYLSLQPRSSNSTMGALPPNCHDLGDLGLSANATTTELAKQVPAFQRTVASFCPALVLAGPVHDGGYVAARAGLTCPWIIQSWAFDVFWEIEQDKEARNRAESVLSFCPAILADSTAVLHRCEAIRRSNMPVSFILPWGIDLERTKSSVPRDITRRELLLDDAFVFLCTRRLEPVYMVDVLLKAFRDLVHSGSEALLLLASSGSLRGEVERWAAKQDPKVRGAIRLIGEIPPARLMDLYAAADAYVSTAASDGSSISLLEAMQLRLVPIVANIGGNPEWVESGVNGWLAPVGDAPAFANAMRTALQLDEVERRRITTENRARIAKNADLQANMRKLTGRLLEYAALRTK